MLMRHIRYVGIRKKKLFLHTENSVYYCGEGVFGFIIKERIKRRWGVRDAGI